jgi:phosphate/sulfate permease
LRIPTWHSRQGIPASAAEGLVAAALVASILAAGPVWAEGDKNRRAFGAWDIWNPGEEGFLWFWIPVLVLLLGAVLALAVLRPWKRQDAQAAGREEIRER